jgi:hypothetical protein
MSEFVREVERTRKPWITQGMISKTNEQRKSKNGNNKEGRRTTED